MFISYGRADALEFAERLAADLQKLGRYDAFFDKTSIEKGSHFEVVIEAGIRKSNIFIAVMTQHSLRQEGDIKDRIDGSTVPG